MNLTTSSTHGIKKIHDGDSLVSMVKLDLKNFYKQKRVSYFFFRVQGRAECELNKLHACILEHLSFEKAFETISCMMRSFQSNIDGVSALHLFNFLHQTINSIEL